MTVFNVEREEHAARIARKEIGQRLENIPLEVLVSETIDETDEGDTSDEETDDETPADSITEEEVDASGDDVLPEFEDLIDEN
jgi:hypothetical protein